MSKLVKLFLSFVFLLLVSETGYALKNASLNNLFVYYRLALIKHYLSKNDYEKTFTHLYKLTDIVIKYQQKKYEQKIPKEYFVAYVLNNNKKDFLNDLLFKKITEVNFFQEIELLDVKLSYIYYIFAISGENENTDELLKTAVYLNPDFSFYYIELANYYDSMGKKEESSIQINTCISLDYPRKHCEEYLYGLMNLENAFLGFQKDSVDKYFKEKYLFLE